MATTRRKKTTKAPSKKAAARKKAIAKIEITPKKSHSMGRAAKLWKAHLLTEQSVRQMMIDLAGENTLHVIGDFEGQMSDEEIAKKTKLRTSDVRVVLNKLHSCGLVSYSRSRDKNSGWYSYVWKMNNDKAKEIVDSLMQSHGYGKTQIQQNDEASENENYRCKNCGPEKNLSFEEASEKLFRCDNCGSSLDFVESAKE